jgi:acetyl esterase/lipase
MKNTLNLFASLVVCAAAVVPAAVELKPLAEVKLWPRSAPGEKGPVGPETVQPPQAGARPVIRLTNVSEPSIAVYRPAKAGPGGTAIVVCPGGGYRILARDLEGTEIAAWLNSIGVTAVVLKYRVPQREHDPAHDLPLQDAQRAIRLVRKNARAWGIREDRVGILGFSAGGHLAVMAATRWQSPAYEPADDADRFSARPDFVIPIYPAYLERTGALGISADTPPAFIAVTWDDANRGADAALAFAEWKKNKVPAELHIFSRGGHGYGLRPSEDPVSGWPKLCEAWLRVSGLL